MNNNANYCMASSVSGQDEPNRALRLATRAGKIELSCPLWQEGRAQEKTAISYPVISVLQQRSLHQGLF